MEASILLPLTGQIENRRNERHSFDLPVRLYKGSKSENGKTSITDLSLEGFSLKTPVLIDSGERVGFRLFLAGGLHIEGSARVRWHAMAGTPFIHGLEIVEMSFLHRQRLRQCLYPDRFNVLKFGDLILNLGAALTVLFALRRFWDLHPAMQAMSWTYVPILLIAGWVLWAISLILENCR